MKYYFPIVCFQTMSQQYLVLVYYLHKQITHLSRESIRTNCNLYKKKENKNFTFKLDLHKTKEKT